MTYVYRQDIRISVIGDRTGLPKSLLEVISEAEEKTRANSRLHLILAVGYGGQNEIVQACKNVCKKEKDGLIREEEINDKIFEQELETRRCTQFPLDLFNLISSCVKHLVHTGCIHYYYLRQIFAKFSSQKPLFFVVLRVLRSDEIQENSVTVYVNVIL